MPLYAAGQRIRGSEINALPQTYYTTSDLTSAVIWSTATINATGLAFPAEAGARYLVELFLLYSAPTANDIVFVWSLPAGVGGWWAADGIEASQADVGPGQVNRRAEAVANPHAFAGGGGISANATPFASFLIGATPGTVQLKFGQLTTGGSSILRAGSAMRVSRLV